MAVIAAFSAGGVVGALCAGVLLSVGMNYRYVFLAALFPLGAVVLAVDVVADGHAAIADVGALHRHDPGAEEAGVDREPGGLFGHVVVVDRADLPDLVAIAVAGGGPDDVSQLVLRDHLMTSLSRCRSRVSQRRGAAQSSLTT